MPYDIAPIEHPRQPLSVEVGRATITESANVMLPLTLVAGMATGIVLGLLGSGGAILTVPTLVYFLGVAPKSAIAMSLGVVGIAAAVAGVTHWRQRNVNLPMAIWFTGFGVIGTYFGTRIGASLPATVQFIVFALVMYGAAFSMLRRGGNRNAQPVASSLLVRAGKIAAAGTVLGLLTGIIGIGGGFLIVPALALFAGLSMAEAVGTSLVVVTNNAAVGFVGYLGTVDIDWWLFAMFTAIAVAGGFVGTDLSRRMSAGRLRTGFGWFLVVTASFMVFQEVGHL